MTQTSEREPTIVKSTELDFSTQIALVTAELEVLELAFKQSQHDRLIYHTQSLTTNSKA